MKSRKTVRVIERVVSRKANLGVISVVYTFCSSYHTLTWVLYGKSLDSYFSYLSCNWQNCFIYMCFCLNQCIGP